MGLALEEQQHEEDMLVESNGTKVVFSKYLEDHVSGLTVDYSDKWFNKGFSLTGGSVGSC